VDQAAQAEQPEQAAQAPGQAERQAKDIQEDLQEMFLFPSKRAGEVALEAQDKRQQRLEMAAETVASVYFLQLLAQALSGRVAAAEELLHRQTQQRAVVAAPQIIMAAPIQAAALAVIKGWLRHLAAAPV
jgi:hypothetical protein